jgi:Ca-activated chloride channel family protein
MIAGLLVTTVALARPQAVVALPREEGIVVLAFDVSGSMGAKDISPTRMDAAKAAARDFVAHQPPSVSIGVVAFSDGGVSVQNPTTDQGQVLSAIDRLAPQKGTSLASGISASLDAIAIAEAGPYANDYYTNRTPAPTTTPTPVPAGTHTSAVIVLLTDGENNERPDPLAAAQTAADRGVRIFTVGIGSPGGADLDIGGFTVHTTLDAAELQQIAEMTDGTYYAASDAQQLQSIYGNLDPQLVAKPELTELTAIFAGAGALLLLAGALTSLAWLGRLP